MLAVSGITLAVQVSRRRDARRQVALAGVAAELGMAHAPTDNAMLREFGGFAFYQHGAFPRTASVMRSAIRGTASRAVCGDDDATFTAVDCRVVRYNFTSGSSRAIETREVAESLSWSSV